MINIIINIIDKYEDELLCNCNLCYTFRNIILYVNHYVIVYI